MARFCSVVIFAVVSMGFVAGCAQEPSERALVAALRGGGYAIVMRHASSPRTPPDAADAAPGNVDHERQLDAEGRETATAMGNALRRLEIPIGEVLSSPTFRAMQTAQLLHVRDAEPIPELGDGGRGMSRDVEGARSAWLRAKAAEPAPSDSNRLMITHVPNLLGAFGDAAADMRDGESMIVKPEGGSPVVVARVKIEDWAALASAP
jgi:Histidine phosphatase superfamily (branch 1)